jgi:uncharacterized protein (TIGR02145 family)
MNGMIFRSVQKPVSTGIFNFQRYSLAFALAAILIISACDQEKVDDNDLVKYPVLTTKEVTAIRATTASSGGNVIDVGTVSISSRGIIWGRETNPEFGTHEGAASAGIGLGEYTARLRELTPDAMYFVRAYATHKLGTAYAEQVSFTTLADDTESPLFDGLPCPDLPIFTDPRDGQEYNTVQIGNQCWMKENLNYMVENSWCYRRNPEYCLLFGRLYTWYAMMAEDIDLANTSQKVQGVCPSGWHIPSDNEWKILERTIDSRFSMDHAEWDKIGFRGFDVSLNLKADTGWFFEGNGSGLSGFAALPGGRRFHYGQYYASGEYGYWWTSTSSSDDYAHYRFLHYNNNKSFRSFFNKESALSVRCIRD